MNYQLLLSIIKIRRELLTNLRFTDDIVLFNNTAIKLVQVIQNLSIEDQSTIPHKIEEETCICDLKPAVFYIQL